MRTVLINPPLVLQRGDFLGSGIPYMPHGLAYLAAALKRHGFGVRVVDLFGENPFSGTRMGAAVLQGKGCPPRWEANAETLMRFSSTPVP
jgi:hypothetical protein